MRWFAALAMTMASLALGSCTSDPNAPVNASFPIRQMDRFFNALSPRPPPPPDYTRAPGYAPPYPPYE